MITAIENAQTIEKWHVKKLIEVLISVAIIHSFHREEIFYAILLSRKLSLSEDSLLF